MEIVSKFLQSCYLRKSWTVSVYGNLMQSSILNIILVIAIVQSETYAVGRGVSDSKLIAVAGDDSDDDFVSADEGSSPTLLSKKKQAIQRQQSTSVYLRSDVELQFELKRVRQKEDHVVTVLQSELRRNESY